jgi:hypothetical protein
MSAFAESVVEEAALPWLGAIGYAVALGLDVAGDDPVANHADIQGVR